MNHVVTLLSLSLPPIYVFFLKYFMMNDLAISKEACNLQAANEKQIFAFNECTLARLHDPVHEQTGLLPNPARTAQGNLGQRGGQVRQRHSLPYAIFTLIKQPQKNLTRPFFTQNALSLQYHYHSGHDPTTSLQLI